MGVLLFGISGGEVFLVIFIILVLFGADKIPELVRSFGKGMNEFKKAADEIKRELVDSANDIKQEAMELTRGVQDEIHSATKEMKDGISDFSPYEDLKDSEDLPQNGNEETIAPTDEDVPKGPETISRKKRGPAKDAGDSSVTQ